MQLQPHSLFQDFYISMIDIAAFHSFYLFNLMTSYCVTLFVIFFLGDLYWCFSSDTFKKCLKKMQLKSKDVTELLKTSAEQGDEYVCE